MADELPQAAGEPDAAERFVRVGMFTFLSAVAASADLDDRVVRTAVLVALRGDGVSGAGVTLDEDALAAARSVSKSTLWRHLRRLRGTWLEQTTAPTYRGPNSRGRRARYHLRAPESCVTAERGLDTRRPVDNPESCVTSALGLTHDDPSRVAFSAESCVTAERESESRPTPNGPTPPLPPHVEQRVRSHLAGEGIDTDEQDALLAYAAADPDTDTVGRLTTKWLPDARRAVAGQQRKRLAVELDRRKAEAPDCEHEWPAGTALHPASRQPICPVCRRTSERASA